jgi:hypothetical protein
VWPEGREALQEYSSNLPRQWQPLDALHGNRAEVIRRGTVFDWILGEHAGYAVHI